VKKLLIVVGICISMMSINMILFSQEEAVTKIQDIKMNKELFLGKTVILIGSSAQWFDGSGSSSSYYFLKDEWDGIIKVKTTLPKTEPDKRYIAIGVVGYEGKMATDAYIIEQKRTVETRINDINNIEKYNNEVVNILGHVVQWGEKTASSTAFYLMRDDWGGTIKIRTSQKSPEVGKRYSVTGVVNYYAGDLVNPFISEEKRVLLESKTLPAEISPGTSQQPVAEKQKAGGISKQLLLIIVGAAVLLIILVITLLVIFGSKKKGKKVRTGSFDSDISPILPEPVRIIEGSTIKMPVPPEGTLKLLPGRLRVVSGDDSVKEIRFYRIPSQDVPEITFGRASGKQYSHIQLKPMTVSSRQAKITYIEKDQGFVLTNFAKKSSNPTVVNGAQLEAEQSVDLKKGDKIEMGEIVFEFST